MSPVKTAINHYNKNLLVPCLALSGMLALFFYGIFLSFTRGALLDMWETLYFIQSWDKGTLTLAEFLEKHNGIHVEAIPKIFYFIEYFVFHGQSYFLLAVSLACLFACYGVILRKFLAEQSPRNNFLVFLSVSVVFYSGWQIPNLVYVYQVQWYLSWLFTLVAIVLVSESKAICPRYFLALFFAALASLCNFSGVVTLLMITGFGICYANGTLLRGTLCIAFVVFCWLFYPDKSLYRIAEGVVINTDEFAKLYAQPFPGQIDRQAWFPWFFVAFLRRLASPVTELSAGTGFVSGILILVFLAGSVVRMLRSRMRPGFPELLTIYSLLLVAAITHGRYQGGGIDNSRYVTASIMVMCCVVYWSFHWFPKHIGWKLTALWMVFFMILGLVTIDQGAKTAIKREKANISIHNGIFYNSAYEKTYSWILAVNYNPFRLYYDYLKQNNMDIFYNDKKRVDEFGSYSDQCEAGLRKFYNLPRNNVKDYYLDMWDVSADSPVTGFYLVKDGQVAFYGETYSKGLYWIPVWLHGRDSLESYISIPGNFNLRDYEIIGETAHGQYCHVTWAGGKNT